MKTIQTITTVFMLLAATGIAQFHSFRAYSHAGTLHSLAGKEDEKDKQQNDPEAINFDCTVPPRPGSISGSPVACWRLPTTYSISPVPGATSYAWTVVGGGIIGSKTGPTITVNWGWGAKSVSVRAVNNCGSSSSRSLSIIRVLDCTLQ